MLNSYNNKSPAPVSGSGTAPASAPNKNLRRSERVFVNLPIRVSRPTERGEEFLGEGQTLDVSHDGAAIMVDRDLPIGQTVQIRRVGVHKEAPARVVGYYKDHPSNGHVFGVALTDADKKNTIWDIAFPTAAEPEKTVLRALLRCVACGRLEVSYLNEFESDLFLSHNSVARLCAQCGSWTTWNRPYGSIPAGAADSVPLSSQDSATLGQNHRAHERLRMETVGCIRNSALGNEVVLVSSLARGGLSFLSPNEFPEGTCIEMAIPYTSKAPNIYSLVKIVGARKPKDSNLTEYRAVYLV